MAQMAPVYQIHAQHDVSRFHKRFKYCRIGQRTSRTLQVNIDIRGTHGDIAIVRPFRRKYGSGASVGDNFNDISKFGPLVKPRVSIALIICYLLI